MIEIERFNGVTGQSSAEVGRVPPEAIGHTRGARVVVIVYGGAGSVALPLSADDARRMGEALIELAKANGV